MNVKGMPLAGNPHGFIIVIVVSVVLSLVVALWFSKKNMFR
jgi:magnesium transporter